MLTALRENRVLFFPLGLLLLAIVFVPVRMLDERGWPRYRALKRELVEVDAANVRLEHEVKRLQHHVEALRRDPGTLERVARDELGLVRRGEFVFQFED